MFKKAVVHAFRWSTKWYFGSFGGGIATFFFFEKYLEFDRGRSIKYGIAVFVLSFLIKALYQYIKEIDLLEQKIEDQDTKLAILDTKKEKRKILTAANFYGEAIIILKTIFSKIHYLRKLPTIEDAQLMEQLVFLCNQLKELFQKRFNHEYSVCVKVLAKNVDLNNITSDAEVTTLCRDAESYIRRTFRNTIPHNIFENTCFLEIFHSIDDPDKSHYLNNDLPEDKYYKNTSSKIFGEIPPEATNTDERRKAWKLPYRSELVVPLLPLHMNETGRKKFFLGYLCVDCDQEDGFHTKYDVQMLKGVADGIYDIIKLKYKLK